MKLWVLQNTTKLTEGDPFGFVVNVFNDVVPIPIMALLVFGTVGAGYYITQRSVVIPVIMFILIGGTTFALVPISVLQGLVAAMVIVMAGVGYILLQRVTV
jgi:hypothetical protein